ncbi:MAG: hypothetical protein N3F64_02385 [Nitrososphaeria archaeon]|nr:hypothetical protein [Nitrososphaeria archaeon]
MLSRNGLIKAYKYFGINFRNYILWSIILSLTPSTLISIYFPSENTFLKLVMFFTITIICQYLILTIPYLLFSQHDFIISLFGYLILSDLKIITRYSSLYDACLHIYRAKYPIVSQMFKKILVSGIRGYDIKEALNHFALSQPSQSFREGLQKILLERTIEKNEFYRTYITTHNFYREITSKIETKFSILIGLCFFTPIVSTIFISMYVKEVYPILIILSTAIFMLSIIYITLTRSLYLHKVNI